MGNPIVDWAKSGEWQTLKQFFWLTNALELRLIMRIGGIGTIEIGGYARSGSI
jgi:hypothetical protein